MAIIYYPKGSVMFQRDALSGSYEQISLNITPNTILYFDTSSTLNAVSSSTMYLTASNAIVAETSTSSSYAASTTIADVALISDQSISSSYLEGNAVISESILFTTGSNPAFRQEGRVFWDYDAHTLAIIPDKTGSTLQIGQEQWLRVMAHENIYNGAAVYVDDSVVNIPCVHLAIADGGGVKYNVIGIATEDISSGSYGIITTTGQVHELNTSAFLTGQILYLSNVISGSYTSNPPPDPYETVVVGIVVNSDVLDGIIQVNVSNIGTNHFPFVGMVNIPSITSSSLTPSGSMINIGTGSVNLCVTSDGRGVVKNYQLQSASFSLLTSSFLDAQYVAADWNGGVPNYTLITNKSNIDNIQSTLVYTVLLGAGGVVSYATWDTPGILLANKDLARVQALRGIEREDGFILGESGSRYITLTSGSAWQGIQRISLPTINSSTNRIVLVGHSASLWSGSVITQYVNDRYDNGTNLVVLPGGNNWVVNWVYRAIGNQNSTLVQLGTSYPKLTDAVGSQPPAPPAELSDVAFLVGRAIYQSGVSTAAQIDSAFAQTFVPAGITDHNNLNNLQGGTTGEYYHLTSASYANIHDGTSSFALTSSFIRYTGETTSSAASASAILDGYMRVMIGTSARWIPYYNIP